MLYAQYCRIEVKAGGVGASDRALIKAAHTKLRKAARGREYRDARHGWLRALLEYHREAKALYINVINGRGGV